MRAWLSIGCAILALIHNYMALWYLSGTHAGAAGRLAWSALVGGFCGWGSYQIIRLRQAPEGRNSPKYHVLTQSVVVGALLGWFAPLALFDVEFAVITALGSPLYLLGLVCMGAILEYVFLRGTSRPSLRRLMPGTVVAIVSFFLNYPLSFGAVMTLDVLGATEGDIGTGLLLFCAAYLAWFLGFVLYLCFASVKEPSARRRVLAAARRLLLHSAIITFVAAACLFWSPPPRSTSLAAWVLHIAYFALIAQATFWILLAGNSRLNAARRG